MNHACSYCGYNSLNIVRDYTGAPYGMCPRCYRRDPFYRFKPVSRPIEKTALPAQTAQTTSGNTAAASMLARPPAK